MKYVETLRRNDDVGGEALRRNDDNKARRVEVSLLNYFVMIRRYDAYLQRRED